MTTIEMPAEPEQARVWTYDDHSSEWVQWDRNGWGEWERPTGMSRTSHKWTDVLLSGPVHLSEPKRAQGHIQARLEHERDEARADLARLRGEWEESREEARGLAAALTQATRERDAAQESADQLRRAIARVTDDIIVRSDESMIRSLEDLRIEHDNRGSERDMRARELRRVAEAHLGLQAELARQRPVVEAAVALIEKCRTEGPGRTNLGDRTAALYDAVTALTISAGGDSPSGEAEAVPPADPGRLD